MKKKYLPALLMLIPGVSFANDICSNLESGKAAIFLNDGSARVMSIKDGRGEKYVEFPTLVKGNIVGMCSFSPKIVSTFSNAAPSGLQAVVEVGKSRAKLGGKINAITYRDKTTSGNINYWKSGEIAEGNSLYSYFNNHTNKFELFQASVNGGYYGYYPTDKSSNHDWTYIAEIALEKTNFDGVAAYETTFPEDSGVKSVSLNNYYSPSAVYVSIDSDPSKVMNYRIRGIKNDGTVVGDEYTTNSWQHYFYGVNAHAGDKGNIYVTAFDYSGTPISTIALPYSK
ncbi:MAG: hypothetical protein ACRDCY_04015 [Aeromonas veronii]